MDGPTNYPMDPPIATAEPASSPTAAEYQSLLQQVSDLRQRMETREDAFRDDIIRERRRRELMEDELRQEFRIANNQRGIDAERSLDGSIRSVDDPLPMMDEEAAFRELAPGGNSNRQLAPSGSSNRQVTSGGGGGGLSLNPNSLNPNRNKLKFTAKATKQHDSLDASNRSDGVVGSKLLEGDIPPETLDNGEELEGTDIPLLPHDTFSFLAFSKYTSVPLLVSLLVIGVQTLTLTVLSVDMFGDAEPGNVLAFPSGINQSTATIQVVAIFIITVGQTDLHDSLNTLFVGYDAYALSESIGRPVEKWRWTVSLWVRINITLYALCVTFIMIVTESDTTQVLLDFTSIEFITNLDNIFFWLCAYGYMGFGAQKDATLVLNSQAASIVLSMPKADEDGGKMKRLSIIRSESTKLGIFPERIRKFPRLLFTASLFFIMITGWAIVFNWIRQGEFLCQTIFVQFTDDSTADLAPFTGIYDIGCSDQVSGCRRVKYGEVQRGIQWENFSQTAKFAYCVEKASWGFTFGNETGDVLAGKTSPCNWMAHSKTVNVKTQDSYDIMSTASDPWKVLNRRQIDVPFEGFELQCYDCRHERSFCGFPDRGDCDVVNNRCVCKDGWYGRRCEFNAPCELIEFTNPELDIVDGRKFATEYKRMYHNETGEPVEIYDRPVYEGMIDDGTEIGSTNQVFFNGLRWVLVTDLGDLLRSPKFHGYWSAKWNQYTVEFYSAAVRIDSPEDSTSPEGLDWHFPKPKQLNRNVEGVDLASEAPFKFLCATCNNETNPCLYNGICQPENKTCDCTSGSTGRLCQILPTGNGRCDPFFNNKEHAWDGGDCCEETCVSTDEHTCGRAVVLNSQGAESIGFVGYENCKDPSVARAVSGSRTIYDIKKRGILNCGTIFTTTWFYNFMADQCRAVAAAVLDNPNAIQLFNFTNDRFTGLRDERFDIVFWTDYTANRDVYETSARTGFNYATIPYYFGGFIFAGMKPFGKCADEGDFFSAQCLDIKICLVGGTTWFDTASKVFPSQSIVTYKDFESTVVGLENNECNVIGGSQVDVELISIRPFGFTGDAESYEVGSKLYFKSFETWITREDDRVWSRFTSWVFESLVQAEESNITQTTSDLMGTTDVFGAEFNSIFKRAVAAVGNYGEMWERNLPFTRSGMNLVNDGTYGAMLSYDFGRVSDEGPAPSLTGAIRTIIARDSLRCGITGTALGFAEYDETTNTWSGLDIDLCRGIAAALFDGDDSKVIFSEVTLVNRFSKISSGEVDLVPGATRTLEREVKIGVNRDAFDFSPVYFHDGMIFAGDLPHAVCAENQEFTNANSLGVNCSETRICVPSSSTWYDTLVGKLGIEEEHLLLTSNFEDSMQLHFAGSCNVLVGENGRLNRLSLQAIGVRITENYYIGTRKFTKEPICLMHRSDDPQFSDFIKWIVFGFFYAEENVITSVNFFDMPETNLFGSDLTKMWQHSIRRVGNYAQIYGRNIGEGFPRSGMNLLNDLSSPQLFAAPGAI